MERREDLNLKIDLTPLVRVWAIVTESGLMAIEEVSFVKMYGKVFVVTIHFSSMKLKCEAVSILILWLSEGLSTCAT